MDAARALFHDKDRSQFVIVTIPTLMAAAESARLAASLRQEGIPLETLVVNQVGGDSHLFKCCFKRRENVGCTGCWWSARRVNAFNG